MKPRKPFGDSYLVWGWIWFSVRSRDHLPTFLTPFSPIHFSHKCLGPGHLTLSSGFAMMMVTTMMMVMWRCWIRCHSAPCWSHGVFGSEVILPPKNTKNRGEKHWPPPGTSKTPPSTMTNHWKPSGTTKTTTGTSQTTQGTRKTLKTFRNQQNHNRDQKNNTRNQENTENLQEPAKP